MLEKFNFLKKKDVLKEETNEELNKEKDQEVFSEEKVGDLLADLSMVGPDKLIGYLPLETINKMQMSMEDLKKHFEKRGLKTLLLLDYYYVYDETFLNKFLNTEKNKKILEEKGWPTKAEEFVKYLEYSIAEQKTALFDLIADCFADRKNPGRRNNKI